MYHLGALPYPMVWSWTQYFFTLTSMSLYIFSPFLKIPLCPSPQSGFAQAIQPQPSAHHLPCLVTSSRLPSLHPTLLRSRLGALFIASPASSADCPHSAHYANLKPPLPRLPFSPLKVNHNEEDRGWVLFIIVSPAPGTVPAQGRC